MLKKLLLNNAVIIQARQFSSVKNVKKEKFDIFAGVLIERLPIISKKFNEIENEVFVRSAIIFFNINSSINNLPNL
jgi:hypothetical protein